MTLSEWSQNSDLAEKIREKRFLILFSSVVCVYAAIFLLTGHRGEVLRENFFYGDALINGVLPFEPYNDLNWEYPPLAYLFLLIPRLFASDPYGYQAAYVVMITIFILIGLVLIRKVSLKYGKNEVILMGLYVFTMVMHAQFFFDRFDIIVGVITISAVYLYLEKRYPSAFLLLVVGMFIKLYPGLFFLIFLIPLIVSDRKNALGSFATFVISSVVLIIPFALMSPDNFLNFLSYHSDRGIQLESVAASFILLLENFGLTSTYTNNVFWSFNIEGGLADTILPIMMPLLISAVLAFYLLYYVWCKKKGGGAESILWASFAVLMIFIVFNKVFSAQYIIWIMMALIPFAASVEDKDRFKLFLLMFVSMILIAYIFDMMYVGLCYHEPFAVMVLLMRNLMAIAMTIAVIRYSGLHRIVMDSIRSHRYDGAE
jgi:Protein of unknown function (DUF2029).